MARCVHLLLAAEARGEDQGRGRGHESPHGCEASLRRALERTLLEAISSVESRFRSQRDAIVADAAARRDALGAALAAERTVLSNAQRALVAAEEAAQRAAAESRAAMARLADEASASEARLLELDFELAELRRAFTERIDEELGVPQRAAFDGLRLAVMTHLRAAGAACAHATAEARPSPRGDT